MGIERMQERSTGQAICSTFRCETSRVYGSCITTNHVVAAASRIIRVVDTELRLVENIECLETQFELATLVYFKMTSQSDVEI